MCRIEVIKVQMTTGERMVLIAWHHCGPMIPVILPVAGLVS